MLPRDPVPWLVDPANASARLLTLRYVFRRPEPELSADRERLLSWTPVVELRQHWNRINFWGRAENPYYGGPVGNFGVVSLMAQLGAPLFPELESACESLLSDGRRVDGRFAPQEGPQAPWLCYTGMALYALRRLGYAEDIRFQSAWQALLHTVLEQPGRLVCSIAGGLCRSGQVKALGALLDVPPEARTPDEIRAVDFLCEQLLSHPFDFGGGDATWLQLGFPRYYETDVVEFCHILARTPYAHHHRTRELLQRMLNLQTEEGRWRKMRTTPMLSFERIYQPSRWLTLEAVHTLILIYGDTIYAS